MSDNKCWLFDKVPSITKIRKFSEQCSQQSRDRFDKWTNSILGDNFSLNYASLRSAYISSLNQYNIGYTSTYDDIADIQRKKIVEDLTRTLQKIRYDFDQNVEPPNEKEKKQFCAILRITLLLHLEKNPENNKFKYRQSLIELILPIYNTVWYALDNKDTYLIESVTKYLFKQFMKKTDHIQKIPGSSNFQANLEDFKNSLRQKAQSACNYLEKNGIQLIIPFKWYSLLFTQEFTFDTVISIWDKLVIEENFSDCVIQYCAKILKKIEPEFQKLDKQQVMQKLQDISKIDISEKDSLSSHFKNLFKKSTT